MKIEEAMVYLLATSQHGMKTEQIARELELRGLVPRRRDGRPLDGKVIAAIVFKHPEVFFIFTLIASVIGLRMV